jgi:hypothetical protein
LRGHRRRRARTSVGRPRVGAVIALDALGTIGTAVCALGGAVRDGITTIDSQRRAAGRRYAIGLEQQH